MSATQNTAYSPVATGGTKNGTGVEQMQSGDGGGVGFKKTMGLMSGCNVCIGTIIGSGIFVSRNAQVVSCISSGGDLSHHS